MKQFELYGKLREKTTKGAINSLRADGFIPGVIYGGEENKYVYFFINDLKKLLYTDNIYFVNTNIEGTSFSTVVKDVQYHPLSDEPIHIDLLEVDKDKVIKVAYPIHFIGTPEGTKAGGKVQKKKRTLKLMGKISILPDLLQIDISNLNVGETLKVKDVKIEGVEILDQENTPLISVARTRATVAEGGKK